MSRLFSIAALFWVYPTGTLVNEAEPDRLSLNLYDDDGTLYDNTDLDTDLDLNDFTTAMWRIQYIILRRMRRLR